MPFLDWKDARLEQNLKPEGTQVSRTHWILHLSGEQIATLASELQDLFEEEDQGAWDPGTASELRLDLPKEWILFWKQRPANEGSRLLVAHPELEKWVGTLALEPALGREWIARLRRLAPGESLESAALTSGTGWRVAPMSNLELTVMRIEN